MTMTPKEAYMKALEEGPSDSTRQAVLGDIVWSYMYAQWVDGSPRDDTRQAVLSSPEWSSPEWSFKYTKNVDPSPHPDIIKIMKLYLLSGNEWAVKFFEE